MSSATLRDPHRTPSQREQQRAQTRERIFQAAVAEFRRVGVGAAQIPRIAKAAGVVRGTFYFHFPSKDHVLVELSLRVQREIADGLRALGGPGLSLRRILGSLVEGIGNVTASMEPALIRDVLGMYVRAPLELDRADQPQDLLDALSEHLYDPTIRRELRGDLAPEEAARLILNCMMGLIAAPIRAERPRAEEFDQLTDVLVRGLGGQP